MSHELRTPLNSLADPGQADRRQSAGQPQRRAGAFAKTIYSSGNDLLVLINDILDLSKIEAGHADITAETFSLQRFADAIRQTFAPIAEDKGLEFAIALRRRDAGGAAHRPAARRADRQEPAFQRLQVHRARLGRPADLSRPRTARSASRCATPASAFPRNSRRACSKRSGRPTARSAASTAAPASGCRSRANWRGCSAARSRSTASSAAAAPSR